MSLVDSEAYAALMLAFDTFADAQETPVIENPSVAVYYFPNYHPGDPRNESFKGEGWSEWELVKQARPRFPRHDQPKLSAWGYEDESDPKVMEKKIKAAADHNVDAFIFDWYYYDDGPFLNRCLDHGYLHASNRDRVKFALMWANHDWTDIHPYRRGTPPVTLYPGKVSPESFEKICDHIIEVYFHQPTYWRVAGKPYFSFYDLSKLVENFGSVKETRAALDRFREKAVASGLPGIHLNAVSWGRPILPGEKTPANMPSLVHKLGFDSVTSYVWIHHVHPKHLQTDYNRIRDLYNRYWDRAVSEFGVPYFPNVSMGWDSSPRAHQSDLFDDSGYPFMNTISGNSPERFKEALQIAHKRLVEQNWGPRILTINSWNEWTEGSYIEPDAINGMKYLEAIRDVFEKEKDPDP